MMINTIELKTIATIPHNINKFLLISSSNPVMELGINGSQIIDKSL